MNISNFIEWFLTQFVRISSNMLGKLDQIILYGNVSLMDFIITIAIIGAFISIVLTIPSVANRQSIRYENKERAKQNAKKGKK